jgi:hypothetical protein
LLTRDDGGEKRTRSSSKEKKKNAVRIPNSGGGGLGTASACVTAGMAVFGESGSVISAYTGMDKK